MAVCAPEAEWGRQLRLTSSSFSPLGGYDDSGIQAIEQRMSDASEKIAQLAQLAFNVMTAAIIADRTDPLSALREFLAGGHFLTEAQEKYANDPLIQAVIQRLSLPHADETPSDAPAAIDMHHREQEYAALVGVIREAVVALGDSEDLVKYKRFLVELAESVVQASGAGWLGTGEKVSTEERAFLETLKEMLGPRVFPSLG